MNKNQRRAEWSARIADYRSNGMTMSTWCNAHHCSIDQLKYRFYKANRKQSVASITVSPRTPAPAEFVPLAVSESVLPPTSAHLVVVVGSVRIELQPGFDPQLLRDAVQALC